MLVELKSASVCVSGGLLNRGAATGMPSSSRLTLHCYKRIARTLLFFWLVSKPVEKDFTLFIYFKITENLIILKYTYHINPYSSDLFRVSAMIFEYVWSAFQQTW